MSATTMNNQRSKKKAHNVPEESVDFNADGQGSPKDCSESGRKPRPKNSAYSTAVRTKVSEQQSTKGDQLPNQEYNASSSDLRQQNRAIQNGCSLSDALLEAAQRKLTQEIEETESEEQSSVVQYQSNEQSIIQMEEDSLVSYSSSRQQQQFGEDAVDNEDNNMGTSQQMPNRVEEIHYSLNPNERYSTAKKSSKRRSQQASKNSTSHTKNNNLNQNNTNNQFFLESSGCNDIDDSECNLACSSNSSPEHKIHTVVVGAMSQQLPYIGQTSSSAQPANNSSCWTNGLVQTPPDRGAARKCILESPDEMHDNTDCTPKTPQTNTQITTEGTGPRGRKQINDADENSPEYNDITSYTNGNMADLMDEEDAIKREKAEFMYMFDGAMSVIQETEEPEDIMTIKNSSAQSSVLMLHRLDSLATPNERMSKEPMPNRPHEFSMISPNTIMVKNAQSMMSSHQSGPCIQQSNGHFAQNKRQKKISIIKEQSSILSQQEDSHNGQMESMDDASKPTIHMTNQPQPKSMSCIDDNSNTTFSKLSDLTKNYCVQQAKTNNSNQNHKQIMVKNSKTTPKKSAGGSGSGSNSSSQLKSYLQRQQELMKKNMVPSQDNSRGKVSAGGAPMCHQVYRSPERPPQPKNLSHASSMNPSIKNTASIHRESEPQHQHQQARHLTQSASTAAISNSFVKQKLIFSQEIKHIEDPNQNNQKQDHNQRNQLANHKVEEIREVQLEQPSKTPIDQQFLEKSAPLQLHNNRLSGADGEVLMQSQSKQSRQRVQSGNLIQTTPIRNENSVPPGSAKTEYNNLVLSPVMPKQQQEVERFNLRLQALNTSIVRLREDMKERSVLVFKEVKTFNMQQQHNSSNRNNSNSLEEKLDYEFLERVMQVYAFFTSCLNLLLQNDKEAHKLLILQPMIEKHITELKIDRLTLQSSSSNDLFEPSDSVLSSIGGPSFINTSNVSMSNTFMNQLNGKSISITPKRNISVEGLPNRQGLLLATKLQHIQTLLQIASQVLQLNSLKHRLIVDNKKVRSTSQRSEQTTPQLLRGVGAYSTYSNDSHAPQQNLPPQGPLFAPTGSVAQSSSKSKKQHESCPRRAKETRTGDANHLDSCSNSPPRINLSQQQPQQTQVTALDPSSQQIDAYFPQKSQQLNKKQQQPSTTARKLSTKSKKPSDTKTQQLSNQVPQGVPLGMTKNNTNTTTQEEAISTKDSYHCMENQLTGNTPQSSSTRHRRNCSDGQLNMNNKSQITSYNNTTIVSNNQNQQQQSYVGLAPFQRWSDTQENTTNGDQSSSNNQRKQATDTYFNTSAAGYAQTIVAPNTQVKLLQSAPKRHNRIHQGTNSSEKSLNGSVQIINLEKVPMLSSQNLQAPSSFSSKMQKAQSTGSTEQTERQTQDQTTTHINQKESGSGNNRVQSNNNSQSKNNFTTLSYGHNNSFGVTNSSVESGSRNLNTGATIKESQPSMQKNGSFKSIKDNGESFITVLQSSKSHADHAFAPSGIHHSKTSQLQDPATEISLIVKTKDLSRQQNGELGCREAELDSNGNYFFATRSSQNSQYQSAAPGQSRNGVNQPINMASWRSEESYMSLTQYRNDNKSSLPKTGSTSTSKHLKPPSSNFSQTQLIAKQNRTSLSPNVLELKSPKQIQNQGQTGNSNNLLVQLSRNMSTGNNKKSKTIKTSTQKNYKSETLSEVDMSSLSEATIDQFDVIAQTQGVTTAASPVKTKKKRLSKKPKGTASVSKQIVIFADNLSDVQNQQPHDAYNRPEIYTKDMVKSKTRSYLTSITSSVIQTPNELLYSSQCRSPKNGKVDSSKKHKLNHAQSCSLLPESKVKKALKGVISAQEVYMSNKTPKSNKHLTNHTSSINSSSNNVTASFSQAGGVTSPNNRSTSKKKNSSSFHISMPQPLHLSCLDQQQQAIMQQQSSQRRKMHKVSSQQIIHNPATTLNVSKSRMPTEPVSPNSRAHHHGAAQTSKKVMAVTNAQRTSNYLLKQQITLNTDKIQSPIAVKHQQFAQSAKQQPSKMTVTQPGASSKRMRSPSQKSLTQAFNAVAKAISRRQSQSSSTSNTAKISRKHSVVIPSQSISTMQQQNSAAQQ